MRGRRGHEGIKRQRQQPLGTSCEIQAEFARRQVADTEPDRDFILRVLDRFPTVQVAKGKRTKVAIDQAMHELGYTQVSDTTTQRILAILAKGRKEALNASPN